MSNIKVIIESTIRVPYIQIDMSLREARLIAEEHENLCAILVSDLKKALKYINKQKKGAK